MRQEIKNRAKQLLRGNYWPCVAVCAIVYGILYAVSGCTFAVAGILISGPLTVGMAQFFHTHDARRTGSYTGRL